MAIKTALPGMRYGRLVVVKESTPHKGHRRAIFKCDCGQLKELCVGHVVAGKANSCGCLRDELRKTHGMSSTPTYQTWEAMKQRCLNPKSSYFRRYGGRGIGICDRWMLFDNFLADMGEKPEGMSIDRINNDAGYEPGNCRWATNSEQGYNKQKRANCTSQYIGVHYSTSKRKWKAQIKHMGKNRHVGYFASEELAHEAYLNELSKINEHIRID
ncbi:TPA: hypothetical protein ACTYW0_000512 [Enterobacter asburiae]